MHFNGERLKYAEESGIGTKHTNEVLGRLEEGLAELVSQISQQAHWSKLLCGFYRRDMIRRTGMGPLGIDLGGDESWDSAPPPVPRKADR